VQCDRLFDEKLALQCAVTNKQDKTSRNYCPNHLPQEKDAEKVYPGRKETI